MRRHIVRYWTIMAALLLALSFGLSGCSDSEEAGAEQQTVEASNVQTAADDQAVPPEYSRVWEMGGPEEMPLNAEEYHKTWDDMVNSGWVERSLLGYPVHGDENYPMYLYHLKANNKYVGAHYTVHEGDLYERPKILITSGFHGAEKATPVFLRNLVQDMMSDPEFAEIAVKYEWDFVPLVNPWGFSHSMLRGGVLQNGFEYDSFDGYEIVENDKYNQGVRLNEDELNINRDWYDGPGGCPTGEAQLLKKLVSDNSYDLVLDMHETHNTIACGFVSMQKRPDYMSEEEYEKSAAKFYTAVSEAGIVTDRLMNKLYSVEETHQATYPWKGSSKATFRNYAAGYTDGGSRTINHNNRPKYSLCLEVSIYCTDYSGENNTESFNKASNTYGNTFVHYFVKQFDNLLE